jgi:hypothetical protein
VGLIMVQVAVDAAIKWAGAALRDPVFHQHGTRLAERRHESHDRPLFLALGSSRMYMGLDAAKISATDPSVLVYNFSDLGAGPMLEQVFLRRLLAEGVRPDMVLIDLVPLQLATSIVVPSEESILEARRLTLTEMQRVAQYYRFPVTAYYRWSRAVGLPTVFRQTELREALLAAMPQTNASTGVVDGYGFWPCAPVPAAHRLMTIRSDLERFSDRLASSRLADGPVRALRDLVALCRHECLPFAAILMPECEEFRKRHSAQFCADVTQLLEDLKRDGEFPVTDARTWVSDEGFVDAHHLSSEGATTFTDRFIRDTLPGLKLHAHSRVGWPAREVCSRNTGPRKE